MSFLYEKSATWRWIVASSKASNAFFMAFGTVCIVGSMAVGYAFMSATSYNDDRLQQQLSKNTRQDTQLMARLNRERLGELLSEIKNNENTEDRYAAALRGEILTGPPNARVKAGKGTTLPLAEPKKDKEQS